MFPDCSLVVTDNDDDDGGVQGHLENDVKNGMNTDDDDDDDGKSDGSIGDDVDGSDADK